MPAHTQSSELACIETGALLLRHGLGTMFIAHALLKLFVFTLPSTAQFFSSLDTPPALGYLTFAAELLGGVLVIGSGHVTHNLRDWMLQRHTTQPLAYVQRFAD